MNDRTQKQVVFSLSFKCPHCNRGHVLETVEGELEESFLCPCGAVIQYDLYLSGGTATYLPFHDLGGEGTWYDAKEIATRLKCSPSHIYDMAKAGELPHHRLGSRYFFSEENIQDYLADSYRPINEEGYYDEVPNGQE